MSDVAVVYWDESRRLSTNSRNRSSPGLQPAGRAGSRTTPDDSDLFGIGWSTIRTRRGRDRLIEVGQQRTVPRQRRGWGPPRGELFLRRRRVVTPTPVTLIRGV